MQIPDFNFENLKCFFFEHLKIFEVSKFNLFLYSFFFFHLSPSSVFLNILSPHGSKANRIIFKKKLKITFFVSSKTKKMINNLEIDWKIFYPVELQKKRNIFPNKNITQILFHKNFEKIKIFDFFENKI